MRLFLLLALLPLVELSLLVWIAERAGWEITLLLILLPGLLGVWLVRLAGWRCVQSIRARLAQGELPTAQLLDGVMILAAGALLVLPGMLTDVVALTLLVPLTRQLVKRWLLARLRACISAWTDQHSPGDRIIDVRFVDPNEEEPCDQNRLQGP